MRTPDRVIDVGTWMLENGHRALLKLSGGRFPKRLLGMHAVQLVTIGRRTGERRPTLLSAPVYEENRVVLVASKGGYQDHPQWYKNLAANPAVEITVDGRTRAMRARTATPEEREALWPTIVATYKGYAGYQANTARQIPVVICEPLSG